MSTYFITDPDKGPSTSQQREILRALGNIGVMRVNDTSRVFGYDNLSNLEKLKLINRSSFITAGKCENIIILSNKGKDYARRVLAMSDSLYKRSSYQVKHDLKLSCVYLGLKREERETWMNDAAVKDWLDNRNITTSPIDGAYLDTNGELVGVEVITVSYSKKAIISKQSTLSHFTKQVMVNA